METLSKRSQSGCDDALIIQIVTTIAEKEQCDPLALPPISDIVDPDALEQVAGGVGVTEISFSYSGYHVRIEDDGHVAVTPE